MGAPHVLANFCMQCIVLMTCNLACLTRHAVVLWLSAVRLFACLQGVGAQRGSCALLCTTAGHGPQLAVVREVPRQGGAQLQVSTACSCVTAVCESVQNTIMLTAAARCDSCRRRSSPSWSALLLTYRACKRASVWPPCSDGPHLQLRVCATAAMLTQFVAQLTAQCLTVDLPCGRY
jgi:hypothetical protein